MVLREALLDEMALQMFACFLRQSREHCWLMIPLPQANMVSTDIVLVNLGNRGVPP